MNRVHRMGRTAMAAGLLGRRAEARTTNWVGRMAMAASLLGLLMVSSGCHRHPNRAGADAPSPRGDTRPGGGVSSRLEIDNVPLQGDIALVKANGKRAADGILEAQVELRSEAAKARTFEYTFRWYDAKGAEVRDPQARWTMAQILGGDTFQSPAQKAPSADCTEFKMLVRPAAFAAR